MNIQDIYNTQLVQKYNKYIHTCTKYISNLQHTVKTYLGFTKQFEQILCFLKWFSFMNCKRPKQLQHITNDACSGYILIT